MPDNNNTTNETANTPDLENLISTTTPNTQITPYQESPAEDKPKLQELIAKIDPKDRSTIMFFGSAAQEEMNAISESMLKGVRNKDLGKAGDTLNEMINVIKGFNIDELDPNNRPSFFARLFGRTKPIVKFLNRYEDVGRQIDAIIDKLEKHKEQILTDIFSLDKLYETNLDYFHNLELYIAAGEEKLRQIDEEEIPSLTKQAQTDSDDMLTAQKLRDLRSARDDLERRVHDLRLTRQVAMQSLPSIRMIQENDKMLINKIDSTLINTVPLWKNQLAQAVTIFRMSDTAGTVKSATDLTNELLENNSENLRTANAEVRRQMERGVFDIESVKRANQALIETINDSLQIAEEGRAARSKAATELAQMENELRKVLMSAKARTEQS